MRGVDAQTLMQQPIIARRGLSCGPNNELTASMGRARLDALDPATGIAFKAASIGMVTV